MQIFTTMYMYEHTMVTLDGPSSESGECGSPKTFGYTWDTAYRLLENLCCTVPRPSLTLHTREQGLMFWSHKKYYKKYYGGDTEVEIRNEYYKSLDSFPCPWESELDKNQCNQARATSEIVALQI